MTRDININRIGGDKVMNKIINPDNSQNPLTRKKTKEEIELAKLYELK